jgi:exodeoxyribonuclease VIII
MITPSEFLGQEGIDQIKQLKHDSLNIIEASDHWYFNDTKFVTNSMLKLLKNNGPKYLNEYINGNIPQKEESYFVLGSAFHCAVLEPERFKTDYTVFDDTDLCATIGGARPRTTNKYKEEYEKFLGQNTGKQILSIDDYNTVIEMTKAVNNNIQAKQLLDGCNYKETIFTNTIEGINCKSKIDAIRPGDYFIDLKSFFDTPNHQKFTREFFNKDYDMQAALYSDVTKTPNGWIIAVEKTYPFTIGLYEISEETIKRGREKYLEQLRMYQSYFINQDGNSIIAIENFCYMGII